MPFLIDVTDKKFMIPANVVILDFIRRSNPFAHSDVGSKLIEVGKSIPSAQVYCPDFRSHAYVALHTDDHVIFAIAFGMRCVGVLSPITVLKELASHTIPGPEIGEDWISFDVFDPRRAVTDAMLSEWCATAFLFARQRSGSSSGI